MWGDFLKSFLAAAGFLFLAARSLFLLAAFRFPITFTINTFADITSTFFADFTLARVARAGITIFTRLTFAATSCTTFTKRLAVARCTFAVSGEFSLSFRVHSDDFDKDLKVDCVYLFFSILFLFCFIKLFNICSSNWSDLYQKYKGYYHLSFHQIRFLLLSVQESLFHFQLQLSTISINCSLRNNDLFILCKKV